MSSFNVAVPANATSVVVTGNFGSSYQLDSVLPTWLTEVSWSGKTPTQFLLTFTQPAPASGGSLDVEVTTAVATQVSGGALLAGTIVNNVRDDVPDPVYDGGNNPQPDGDGLIRASTLYRWLDSGVKEAARLMGLIIEDWTALAQVSFQPWYPVGAAFTSVEKAFSNQWPIDTITLQEDDVIWPTQSITTAQSLNGYYRKRGANLEFGLWPVPGTTDPATTLSGALAASGVDPIAVGSTTGFLPFGYVQIDAEILQYQQLVSGLKTISRGVCGTTPASHLAGATVQHLGLWLKGRRTPATIVNSLSVVELPPDITSTLEKYLLGRYRGAEEEYDERDRLMKEFRAECQGIRADPLQKENRWQIRAFGENAVGPLIWGGQAIRP